MKIAKIRHFEQDRLAVARGDTWHQLIQTDVQAIVCGETIEIDHLEEPIINPDFRAPYTGGTIFGIGLNFVDTIREMGFPTPESPYLFPKLSSSVISTGETISIDSQVTRQVDWEGELAVIIGKETRNATRTNAMDAVFGYTAANDISARDVQQADPQWVRGKGLDTFCPLGPVIVTADELPDPQSVGIRTWVNGEIVQDGNTRDMLHGVADLIVYLSRHFTLQPGDIILTGTPSGCGGFMTPQRFLSPGDEVVVEVKGIGRLVNPVQAAECVPL